tara:strand:+ start:454 stop:678 length:225 start_codon:yes stop_codon:yes gene_type:complete
MSELDNPSTNMESNNIQTSPNVDKKKKKKKKKSYKSLMKSYLKSNYTDEQRLENQKKRLDNILVDANFKKVDVI